MKLRNTGKKLSLIALLSLGLVCSPLVVNAGDGNRDRHSQHQQDRGKPHYKADRRSGHSDYSHYDNTGDRHSYRKGYKHAYKGRHHHRKHHGKHAYRHATHRHHGHDRHYGHNYRSHHAGYRNDVDYMLGLYSDNLAVIFRD